MQISGDYRWVIVGEMLTVRDVLVIFANTPHIKTRHMPNWNPARALRDHRDLARNRPAHLLDRQYPENSLLDRQRIFYFYFFGLMTKSFPNKPTCKT